MWQGGIILCGGRSTRMGRDKGTLPFGGETLLARMIRLVGEVVPPERIVVVAAEDQRRPECPAGVRVVRDRMPERGPLEGLAVGLAVLASEADAVFVTSCDAPLLVPEFGARLFDRLGEADAVVPVDEEFAHPLTAVYRVRVLSAVETLLAENRRSLHGLLDRIQTRRVPASEFREIDPPLASLANLNTPEAYRDALRRAGLPEESADWPQ